MQPPSILVIDDEPTQLMLLQQWCESYGYRVTKARNGEEGIFYLKQPDADQFRLVITDLNMPVMDGREVIKEARHLFPKLPVIVITGDSSSEIADELESLGAQDFLSKPITPERLKVSIDNALQLHELRMEVDRLRRKESGAFTFEDLIGAYAGLAPSVAMARKYARSDMPVLLTGESGVGKEVFARAIHGESTRAGKPFIAVNCGAIPANLVESTLFGHEKGSFTGAIDKSLGKFREAQGGTLFLDEVGELPLESQVKLLRALQQAEVEPVGLGKPVTIDVRIISATNKSLSDAISEQQFREDLFYRLNVLPLEIPPLRERKADIPELCQFFLSRASATDHLGIKSLSADALQWAQNHQWPGNVRELENTLSRAALLSETKIIQHQELMALAHPIASSRNINPSEASVYRHADGRAKTLEEVTLELVQHRMGEYDNHIADVAHSLGMPASTLYRKLRDWKTQGKLE